MKNEVLVKYSEISQSNYLNDLISRMLDDSPVTDSSKSISFQALREVESLNNSTLLNLAISKVSEEKNKKVRDKLYCIVSKLALNTHSEDAVYFLLDRLSIETDKYVLMSMLDRIAELPKKPEANLLPIIEHTKDKRWQVRYSAINALRGTTSKIAEDRLIEILNNSQDPDDLTYSNATLNRIGTRRALPAIEQYLKSRKRDVKMSAEMAIKEILKRNK